jgi:hypothetical protein
VQYDANDHPLPPSGDAVAANRSLPPREAATARPLKAVKPEAPAAAAAANPAPAPAAANHKRASYMVTGGAGGAPASHRSPKRASLSTGGGAFKLPKPDPGMVGDLSGLIGTDGFFKDAMTTAAALANTPEGMRKGFSDVFTTPLNELHGRGLHSFTLELNLSNSRTHHELSWVTRWTEEL